MKRYASIPLFVMLTIHPRAHAASAEDILGKTREALGGSKLAAVQSLTVSGDYGHAIAGANASGDTKGDSQIVKGELQLSILLPDKFLKEETIGLPNGMTGPVLVECLNGEEVWNDTRTQPNVMIRMPGGDMPGDARKRALNITLARFLLAFLLTDRPAFPLTFTSAGEAEAPDGRADVLEVKGPDNFAARLFVDQKTHLPLMLTYQGPQGGRRMMMSMSHSAPSPDDPRFNAPKPASQMASVQLRLGDYRKVNGVMLPHLLSWNSNGALTDELEVKKFGVNAKLDAGKFRK